MPPTSSMQLYRLSVAFLQDNFILILLVGVGLFGTLIWRIAIWKTAIEKEQGSLATTIANNQGSLKQFVDEIRKEIREDFRDIRKSIESILNRFPPATTRPGSPTTLTDLGREIAQEIQVAQWVPQYAKENLSALRGANPYEVQKICLHHARMFMENRLSEAGMDDKVDTMKMSAFQHGVSLQQVLDVAGIALRDEVLELLSLSPE